MPTLRLLAAFTGPDGQPIRHSDCRAASVRALDLDTARAEFDKAWLNYQQEIGVRHTRRGKNRTDAVQAADHIPLRYVLARLIPITTTLKPFLADGGTPGQVGDMHQAWVKAVLLQVILWSQPYVRDGNSKFGLRRLGRVAVRDVLEGLPCRVPGFGPLASWECWSGSVSMSGSCRVGSGSSGPASCSEFMATGIHRRALVS